MGCRALEADERARVRRRLLGLQGRAWLAGAGVGALALATALAVLHGARTSLEGSLLAVGTLWAVELGVLGVAACLLAGRALWRLPILAAVLAVVGLATLGALVPEVGPHVRDPTAATVVVVVALGNAYALVTVWHGARRLWRAGAVRRDERAGSVDRFEGVIEDDPEDVALERLRQGGYLECDADMTQSVEILPSSSLVLSANGRPVEPWIYAHVACVAPPLLHALRVALPSDIARVEHSPSVSLMRRSLSPAEQGELAQHIASLRRRYWPSVVATAALIGFVAVRFLNAAGASDLVGPGSIAGAVLALVTYFGYFRRLRAARRLAWDRELRWVVTVHDTGPTANQRGAEAPKLEVLPISQLVWTEHARPAAWRTSKL